MAGTALAQSGSVGHRIHAALVVQLGFEACDFGQGCFFRGSLLFCLGLRLFQCDALLFGVEFVQLQQPDGVGGFEGAVVVAAVKLAAVEVGPGAEDEGEQVAVGEELDFDLVQASALVARFDVDDTAFFVEEFFVVVGIEDLDLGDGRRAFSSARLRSRSLTMGSWVPLVRH